MTTYETGLLLQVYTHAPFGGADTKPQSVVLVAEFDRDHPAGTMKPVKGPFTATEENPAVVLVTRHIGGRIVKHVEPMTPVGEHMIGYMASGKYVSGDSRFSDLAGFYGAVAFHDRTETPEEYRALST